MHKISIFFLFIVSFLLLLFIQNLFEGPDFELPNYVIIKGQWILIWGWVSFFLGTGFFLAALINIKKLKKGFVVIHLIWMGLLLSGLIVGKNSEVYQWPLRSSQLEFILRNSFWSGLIFSAIFSIILILGSKKKQ